MVPVSRRDAGHDLPMGCLERNPVRDATAKVAHLHSLDQVVTEFRFEALICR